eukprot:m.397109 g.397109  ORF g.397109 m.397109 type:complete len:210 (+) comp16772_c3_seq34:64-693(+)
MTSPNSSGDESPRSQDGDPPAEPGFFSCAHGTVLFHSIGYDSDEESSLSSPSQPAVVPTTFSSLGTANKLREEWVKRQGQTHGREFLVTIADYLVERQLPTNSEPTQMDSLTDNDVVKDGATGGLYGPTPDFDNPKFYCQPSGQPQIRLIAPSHPYAKVQTGTNNSRIPVYCNAVCVLRQVGGLRQREGCHHRNIRDSRWVNSRQVVQR